MKRILTATLAGVALTASLTFGMAQADTPPEDCAGTLIIAVPGTKSPLDKTPWGGQNGLMNDLVGTYDDLPDSEVVYVDYPASIIGGLLYWERWHDDAVDIGVAKVEGTIATQEMRCGEGNTKYVLVGYSLGAIVVGDAAVEVAKKNPTLAAENIYVEAWSDARSTGGLEDVFSGVIVPQRVNFEGTREVPTDAFAGWSNYCNGKDSICAAHDFGLFWFVKNVFGYIFHHGGYSSDDIAMPFPTEPETTTPEPTPAETGEPATTTPTEVTESVVSTESEPEPVIESTPTPDRSDPVVTTPAEPDLTDGIETTEPTVTEIPTVEIAETEVAVP